MIIIIPSINQLTLNAIIQVAILKMHCSIVIIECVGEGVGEGLHFAPLFAAHVVFYGKAID